VPQPPGIENRLLRKKTWVKEGGSNRRLKKNCITRTFMIYTAQQILLE
jgi:hypothetical protein